MPNYHSSLLKTKEGVEMDIMFVGCRYYETASFHFFRKEQLQHLGRRLAFLFVLFPIVLIHLSAAASANVHREDLSKIILFPHNNFPVLSCCGEIALIDAGVWKNRRGRQTNDALKRLVNRHRLDELVVVSFSCPDVDNTISASAEHPRAVRRESNSSCSRHVFRQGLCTPRVQLIDLYFSPVRTSDELHLARRVHRAKVYKSDNSRMPRESVCYVSLGDVPHPNRAISAAGRH
mmetsp:Transcript_29006/g.70738  ORF Transcript_29006/g.70738 Transcript_29006/m.70738 type:complete len:234 (+) Transcript_29006:2289-2990(+)